MYCQFTEIKLNALHIVSKELAKKEKMVKDLEETGSIGIRLMGKRQM